MLLKIMGALDLFAAIAILLLAFKVGKLFAILLATYLLCKGTYYIADKTSVIDILCGISIILMSFYGFSLIGILPMIWLAQKGLASLFLAK